MDVLKYAITAILAFQGQYCGEWLEVQQQKRALIHGSREERLAKWLGLKMKLGGREISGLCYFFYSWEMGLLK